MLNQRSFHVGPEEGPRFLQMQPVKRRGFSGFLFAFELENTLILPGRVCLLSLVDVLQQH